MNFVGIELNMKLKETELGAYGFWKLLFIIFFVLYCFRVEGDFDTKLPTYLILIQIASIETLITARFDSFTN